MFSCFFLDCEVAVRGADGMSESRAHVGSMHRSRSSSILLWDVVAKCRSIASTWGDATRLGRRVVLRPITFVGGTSNLPDGEKWTLSEQPQFSMQQ